MEKEIRDWVLQQGPAGAGVTCYRIRNQFGIHGEGLVWFWRGEIGIKRIV